MTLVGIGISILLEYSQATAIMLFGLYIAYEIRWGVLKKVRDNQRTLGVALYRVIERDNELDEEVFRDAFWDEDSEDVLLSDFDRGE